MNELVKKIAECRAVVGYLGEKGQAGWWESSFLGSTSSSFLAPIFHKSLSLAQYQGVTTAAALVHDEVIGAGCTYHLFRLPIHLEQLIAEVLRNQSTTSILSQEHAMSTLLEIACGNSGSATTGPILIGKMTDDLLAKTQEIAGVYHAAFIAKTKAFPYLKEDV